MRTRAGLLLFIPLCQNSNLADIKLKKQIARQFGLPQHIYFESWIQSLTALRNCIAHHNRIWNRRFPIKGSVDIPWGYI